MIKKYQEHDDSEALHILQNFTISTTNKKANLLYLDYRQCSGGDVLKHNFKLKSYFCFTISETKCYCIPRIWSLIFNVSRIGTASNKYLMLQTTKIAKYQTKKPLHTLQDLHITKTTQLLYQHITQL